MGYYNRTETYEDLGFTDDMASVLDVDRITEICRRRADKHEVTVTWSASALTACTNAAGDIVLPIISQPISKDDLAKTHMYVVHECGHLLRPEAFEICKKEHPSAELHSIYNIVEDDGMERDMANRHLGDAKVLGQGNALICISGTEFWQNKVDQWRTAGKEFTEDALKPMITIALNQLSRRSWDGWSRDAVDKWLRVMPEEGQPLLTALVKEGWIEKFRATKTPYDTWDVACALFDRLYPDGVPEDRPTPDIKAESDMIIEEDVGSSASKEEGDSETEDQTQQGYVVNWQDAVVSDPPEGNAGGAMGITWEGKEHKQQVKIRPDHLNTVYDLTVDNMKEIIDEAAPWTGKGKGVKWFMMKDNAGRALANRIRRYVQSQTRSKFKSDQKHGRLDKRSLVRVALPPIDKGEWNKKIFYTRNNKRALNTAIHILVDWSGSMQGDKQIYAAMATQRAAEVFSRSLRIPTMISSFTNGATESDIAIIKHFDKPATEKQIAARFGQWYRLMSANADADAVMWAYNRLRKRKEPRKLLIVLSDGAPANCYGHGSSYDSLMAAVNRIEQEGKVEVFGLGIKSDAVSEYYRNHQVITEPEDINEALLNVLKEGMKYA